MTVGSGVIASGVVGGGAVRSGLIGAGGVPLHRGLKASFVAPSQFYTWPASGSPTIYANAQSMFTWSSSTKWTRQSSGLWAASGANTPAYEWDASGNLLGLRVEGTRTNTCLWSDDMTNAAWVKSNVTAAKTATGADGAANSATTLTSTAGNATVLQTITSASSGRAYGAFVKRRTGSGNIQMTVDNGTTWTTVTVTSSWSLVQITQAAVTNPVVGFRIVTSGDEIDVMWNQMESSATAGQLFVTSPIPTTTAQVTRNTDVIYTTTIDWASFVAGSFVTTIRALAVPNNFCTASFSANGSYGAGNGLLLRATGGTSTTFGGNGFAANVTAGATAAGDRFKIGGTYTVSTQRAIASAKGTNGSAIVNNDFTGSGTQRFTIGALGGGNTQNMYGHIETIEYWPEAFSDSQIATLTT